MTHLRANAWVIGALCAGAMICATAQAGDYYKWTDANDTVHYSQTPPDHAVKTVNVDDDAPTPMPPGMGYKPPPADIQSHAQSNQAALQKVDSNAVAANCSAARQNLTKLQSGKRLARSDNNAQVRTLTPAQREQARADARAQAAHYCQTH
ncbi:MAG: DUF4124 domain-containing protein [Rhodanobacteraceae bacterium]